MTGLPWLLLPVQSLAGAEPGVPKMPGQGGHWRGEWGVCALLKAALCRARAARPRQWLLAGLWQPERRWGGSVSPLGSCAAFLFSYARLLENITLALFVSGPGLASRLLRAERGTVLSPKPAACVVLGGDMGLELGMLQPQLCGVEAVGSCQYQ